MSYTHLLFDLDGTLFDFEAGEAHAFRQVCSSFHIPYSDQLLHRYQQINLSYWKLYEEGKITTSALAVARFRDLISEIHADADPSEMTQTYQDNLGKDHTLIQGAYSLCASLKELGYHISIITNGRSMTQHSRLSDSELTPLISDLFISEEIGFQKPKTEFFDQVFSRLQIPHAQALVIGDSLTSDIRGGVLYGLDTCWFNPSAQENPFSDIRPTYEISSLDQILSILSNHSPKS